MNCALCLANLVKREQKSSSLRLYLPELNNRRIELGHGRVSGS